MFNVPVNPVKLTFLAARPAFIKKFIVVVPEKLKSKALASVAPLTNEIVDEPGVATLTVREPVTVNPVVIVVSHIVPVPLTVMLLLAPKLIALVFELFEEK